MIRAPIMVDSPAWSIYLDKLEARRVLTQGSGARAVRAAYSPASGHWQLLSGLTDPAARQLTRFSTADLSLTTPDPIRRNLARLDGLQRLGAGSSWEALGTAVIRQVIRAGQARRLWHQLAAALKHPGQAGGWFPSEQRFLTASDAELAEVGLGFKMRTLRTVAEACHAQRSYWDQLDPVQLHDAWLELPGIGPWSAGAAIADLRNAWHLYPHDDLAVRTWAIRAFPELDIPTDARAFLRLWTHWAGEALGSLTVLTLGWSATCP